MRNDPQNPSNQKKPGQDKSAQDRTRSQQTGQQAGQQAGQRNEDTQRTAGRQGRDDDTSRKH